MCIGVYRYLCNCEQLQWRDCFESQKQLWTFKVWWGWKTMETFKVEVHVFCTMMQLLAYEWGAGAGMRWLDENVLYRLMCLNTWSPLGRTLWGGLGSAAVLEEVCTSSGPWVLKRPVPVPLPSACGSRCKLSAVPRTTPLLTTMDSNPLQL